MPDQPELPLEIEVAQAAVESLELVFENLIGALLLGLDPGDDPLLGLIEGLGALPRPIEPAVGRALLLQAERGAQLLDIDNGKYVGRGPIIMAGLPNGLPEAV